MQTNILAHSKEQCPMYIDENWLIEQYWGFELTTRQMAELCNCSQGPILKYMRKYEIPLKARFYYYRDQYGRKNCVKCGQWKEITEFYTNGKIKKKGYFLENCVLCCPTCNWMKSDLSLNEFAEKIITLAKWALTYKNRGGQHE